MYITGLIIAKTIPEISYVCLWFYLSNKEVLKPDDGFCRFCWGLTGEHQYHLEFHIFKNGYLVGRHILNR